MQNMRLSQKDYVKTALRLPPELHEALHSAAMRQDRTYNAEIVNRLRSTFEGQRSITISRKERPSD